MQSHLENLSGNDDRFLQIFLFVEHLNHTAFETILDGAHLDEGSRTVWSTKVSLRAHILNTRRSLVKHEGKKWPQISDFSHLLDSVNCLPMVSIDFLDEITEIILMPLKVIKDNKDWRIPDGRGYDNIRPPMYLNDTFYFYSCGNRRGFSSNYIPNSVCELNSPANFFSWDQVIDPFSVIRKWLVFLYYDTDNDANHFIQQWLKKTFNLKYTHESKYACQRYKEDFNKFFFGEPFRKTHGHTRSKCINLFLFIDEIQASIKHFFSPSKKNSFGIIKQAIGYYLFARFCGLLRVSFFYFYKFPSAIKEPVQLKRVSQAFYALKEMEYSYFLIKVFGSILPVEGMNFIFRGGILPRPSSGRLFVVEGPSGSGKTVLSLQRLVGVASRGGLGIYFSFEESRELLIDKLVAFGLVNNDRYYIDEAGVNSENVINKYINQKKKRGLLLLYGSNDKSQFSMLEVLRKLSYFSQKTKWKAIVIDSFDALRFGDSKENLPPSRSQLDEFVSVIEETGFLVNVISELHSGKPNYLQYLSDTTVKLGNFDSFQCNWIEVTKSRGQNFHKGKHKFRILEGKGIKIYPSLSAFRSAFRRKTKSTLSELEFIPITSQNIEFFVKMKSISFILGDSEHPSKKFLMKLLLTDSVLKNENTNIPCSSLVVINFGSSEKKFEQSIKADHELLKHWEKVRHKKIISFTPGDSFGPEEAISALTVYLNESKRDGFPVQRVGVHGIESIPDILPAIGISKLFWPTFFELIYTSALTCFISCRQFDNSTKSFEFLLKSSDYFFDSTSGNIRFNTPY